MTTADFRAQARAVRAATQMKLMELRRNRRAASRYMAAVEASETDTDVVAADPAMTDDDHADPCMEAVAEDASPVAAEPAFSSPDPVEAESPAAAPHDGMTISSATADYIARAARPRAAAAPAAALAQAETTPSPAPAADPTPVAQNPAPAGDPALPSAAPSDLAGLPDIGPGLVWLLQRAGVDSIAELRAADPDALSDRLGLVGRLIDVRALQARASDIR